MGPAHGSGSGEAFAQGAAPLRESALSFVLHGIGVSGGIAIGRAQLISHATLEVAHYSISPEQVPAEIDRLTQAIRAVQKELESLHGKTFEHGLGDGHASERLVTDLVDRVLHGNLRGHLAENSHIDVSRSYREDGLSLP